MVKDKFRNLLDELGVTPEEFGVKIGVGKSGIYKILRGDTKKISDKLSKKISEVYPQYSYEHIKSFNYTTTAAIAIDNEGTIEVQKIVDIVIANYDSFTKNADFKDLLDRHALNAMKDYLAQKK
ncbi:helix-turn-helix transcriptional regulator [Tenacibaculum sp. 190524A02b]|uniref:helix-turn-helix domain-containing protein n=1 Tax=Tenacibaculum vairaonense TaxID=3137860 RepID=UPI0031FAD194